MANEKKDGKNDGNVEYAGFDLFPERRFDGRDKDKNSTIMQYAEDFDRNQCEMRILKAFKQNPLIRVLYKALRDVGCPIDITRHFSCEPCRPEVMGGYDSELNQIVICQNKRRSVSASASTIIHELIHMFDHCTRQADFSNLNHLACSEIRAANLAHCSFLSSFFLGQSSIINIKATHQYCVKMKATQSLMVARQMDYKTAFEVVLRVFDKCYNDLEPIGRRIRRGGYDHALAYKEYKHFGPVNYKC